MTLYIPTFVFMLCAMVFVWATTGGVAFALLVFRRSRITVDHLTAVFETGFAISYGFLLVAILTLITS